MITRIVRDLEEVLDLIIDEKQIVGIFQGKGEWGPRALGNRSILFDPRHPEAKQIVNAVKKREEYRPFAGSVMLEHAPDWFHMLQLKESPWMYCPEGTLNCRKGRESEQPHTLHPSIHS